MKRSATANWQGTGKEGKGTLSTQSNVLNKTQYSYSTRFESGTGTNPEELIAAAHAGCFTMKMSFLLTGAGFPPKNIDTTCEISLEDGKISSSKLICTASVPGISKEKFEEQLKEAGDNCIISKLLNTNISYEGKLV